MGIFSKLTHGGVKVQVQAPSSIPSNQVIPVTINISADSTHTINSVKAEIQAQAREEGVGLGNRGMGMGQSGFGGVGVEESRTGYQTVAQAESRESLSVSPGETKTVNLQLYINGSVGNNQQLGGINNAGGVIGGALRAVAEVSGVFDPVNYVYRVYASADVDGVALHPNDHQEIQILPAQEVAQTQPPAINNFQVNQPQITQPPIEQPPVMPGQNNDTPQI